MSANPTQTKTSQEIINLLKSGTNVFLTGGAGVGKSFTTNLVKNSFSSPVMVAPTGIAAAHIKGETIHSFFKFPIDKEAGMKELTKKEKEELRDFYNKIDLLIIDEISMVGDYLLNWIYLRFKSLDIELGVDIPVLIVGDFYQLPPVSNGDTKFAFESFVWEKLNLKMVNLTKSYRTSNIEFSQMLNELRLGIVTDNAKRYLKQLSLKRDQDDYTYLYSVNKKAFEHNRKMLNKINNRLYVYELSEEFLGNNESQRYEFTMKKNILKSKFENKLFLKKGALVMFTYNDKEKGIYNGKKGYITDIDYNTIYVDGEPVSKETIDINRYKNVNGKIEKIVIGRVTQYPLKLAYAITIHKSQGMSIDGLRVDLSYIFAPGQAYVALSRAVNPNNTKVYLGYKDIDELFFTSKKVDNFYKKNLKE